jgi:DMSO/TMAO reductase YedYZ heme-binding membrane subunit
VELAAAPLTWYTARAGGLLAFALVSASVVLGLALAGRARSRRWPAFALEDVHRFLGLLAGTFIAIHGLALLLDGYFNFTLSSVLVPGAAPTRVVPVALGVVAAELLVALAVTNHYRKEIPHRLWRRLHYLNFAVWGLALVHGITAGSDSHLYWVAGLYAASAGAVLGLLTWRLMRRRAVEPWARRLWPAAGGVFAAELIVALTLGPLGVHAIG